MMKELKFENRYNKKGFLAKRERNRKNGAYLVLQHMGIQKLNLHASLIRD
jgi:hypothetical protein